MKTKRKKIEDKCLAYGEVTGHAHRTTVDVFEDEAGLREFSGPAEVTHEEHSRISIPAKEMTSGIVREHDYFLDLERKVVD